eukprot:gene12288-15024_t
MFPFGPHFDGNKLKVQLKLAVSRIQILRNKKSNLVRDEKRHIAELLRNKNEESARIRIETVIRDENLIECYNIVEVLCELLFNRVGLIIGCDEMPLEIKESIFTLIYTSQRIQIPELELIKKQLIAKYGRSLENDVNCHCHTHVNPKIIMKLGFATPEPFIVFQYLNDIACEFKVDWVADIGPIGYAQPPVLPTPLYTVPQSAQMQPQMPQPMPPQMPPQMPQPIPPQMQQPMPPQIFEALKRANNNGDY